MSRFSDIELDAAIVRRLMRGDRKAQEIVYRAYAGPVYTMTRRMLRDDAAAEEATQDTFIDVLTRAATLEQPAALGGWIRTIAVNHCLMRLRSPWYRRRRDMGGDEPLGADDLAVRGIGDDGPARAVDVDQALARLPPDARMVVWLHCVEGYTHDEIGAAFGRTPSFSKSKLARAYRELAACCRTASPALAGEETEHDRSRATRAPGGTACAV